MQQRTNTQNLKGLKVCHNVSDLKEDEEIILTLKDQQILDKDNIDWNDDYTDELQNIELVQQEKLIQKKAIEKEARTQSYQSQRYDMDMDDTEYFSFGGDSSKSKPILSKYDEKGVKKEGFTLNEHGGLNQETIEKLNQIKKVLQGNEISLNTGDQFRVASDYLDNDVNNNIDLGKFKKPKKKVKKNPQEQQALLEFLESESVNYQNESYSGDHKSRVGQQTALQRQAINEQTVIKEKADLQYSIAMQKSREQAVQMQQKMLQQEEAEEERQLQRAIQQEMKLNALHQKQEEMAKQSKVMDGAQIKDSVLLQMVVGGHNLNSFNTQINQQKAQSAMKREDNKEEEDGLMDFLTNHEKGANSDAKLTTEDYNQQLKQEHQTSKKAQQNQKQDLSIVISSTDFLKNVKSMAEQQEQLKRVQKPSAQNVGGTASVVQISLPTEKILNQVSTSQYKDYGFQSVINANNAKHALNNDQKQKSLIKGDQDQDSSMDEDEAAAILEDETRLRKELEMIEEAPIGQNLGLSSVLEKLRQRGDLSDKIMEQSGRAHDKSGFSEKERYGPELKHNNIKLEYRDDYGRLMTPKQAFRYICWKFHGRMPSKNKQDKKLKKDQVKTKQMETGVGEDNITRMLKERQQRTGNAYIQL